jgi:hypothetical protein
VSAFPLPPSITRLNRAVIGSRPLHS